MSPFIQQRFSLDMDPACIPTFDHGLLQQVYVELPCDQLGQQIPLKQFWRLRKLGGIKWEYYCPCTPPPNAPGIPVRCYEVKKQGSRFFGRVYLGCGKTRQRCPWKVRLDLVFSAAATRLPISSNESEYADPEQFDESFNDKFAQLMDELQIKDNAMAPQAMLTGTSGSEVGENFCKLMGSLDLTEDESLFLQGNAKPPPQLTEEEIAQILSDLTLNEGRSSTVQANPATMVWNEEDGEWQLSTAVYQELVAFFAGQDDVHVSLDGAIHFNPKWATEGNESNGKLSTPVLDDDGDEMGDITLVENSPPKLDDDMSVDLTVVEGPSYSKVQPMYVDLTAEDFPRRGKQKLASLPPDHEMFVDLTWPSIGELPGSGTFEDPYELIDTA